MQVDGIVVFPAQAKIFPLPDKLLQGEIGCQSNQFGKGQF